ncbi:MAG: ACT domain-containing protein [Lachnospiraceae bacterium]|nr:ACT domain-containing protein [Lachnospiraceae bacterium]
MENYLIVHKSILPDKYEKVLEARRLLETGREKEVSQAVRRVGISRSTYYKYRDYIFEPSDREGSRNAVLEMMLDHKAGLLSTVLAVLSDAGASVLTITQSLPIRGKASVTLSVDISGMKSSLAELMNDIAAVPGVSGSRLVDLE